MTVEIIVAFIVVCIWIYVFSQIYLMIRDSILYSKKMRMERAKTADFLDYAYWMAYDFWMNATPEEKTAYVELVASTGITTEEAATALRNVSLQKIEN